MNSSSRFSVLVLAFSAGALFALTGCDKKDPTPASTPATTTTVTAASPAMTAATKPGASTAAGPAAAAEGGALAELFAGAPDPSVKASETVVGTGGVVLGILPKWTSGNVYDAETQYASPAPAGQQGVNIHCQKSSEKHDAGEVKNLIYAAMAQDVKWAEEVDGFVGEERFAAKVGRGTGKAIAGKRDPVTTYYVRGKVPNTGSPVLCAASYPTAQTELGKDLINVFKGMKSAKKK